LSRFESATHWAACIWASSGPGLTAGLFVCLFIQFLGQGMAGFGQFLNRAFDFGVNPSNEKQNAKPAAIATMMDFLVTYGNIPSTYSITSWREVTPP